MRYAASAMAFTPKLAEAARRHLEAADELNGGHRWDVAGYLYGISAECAIKQMVVPLPIPSEQSKRDIHYAHFPPLRTLLRDALTGRRPSSVWRFVADDAFMNRDVRMAPRSPQRRLR